MTAILALTAKGGVLARRLQQAIPDATVYGLQGRVADADAYFTTFSEKVSMLFEQGETLVAICSAGIVMRVLGPLLSDKRSEPPVLALSEDGASVVPLLGGHHGANRLARDIANATGGVAAITTTGDLRLGFSLDEPPAGYVVANPALVKPVTAALLAGEPVRLLHQAGPGTWPPIEGADGALTEYTICVTDRAAPEQLGQTLFIHPPVLTVGVGAERGVPPVEGAEAVRITMEEAGLSALSVAAVGSIDIKADEPAVLAAADALGAPIRLFDAATLEEQAPRLANPSDLVFRETGCHGVAEGAALALAGDRSELVIPKRRFGRVTVAVARAKNPEHLEKGRARGSLYVVGIGPGAPAWRTGEAVAALRKAEVAIGYDLYLDLAADLIAHAEQIRSPLGEEADRAARALEIAATGRSVALICSGDPGIYALATLVFETLDRAGDRALNGVDVTVVPGISAFQATAARLGAPMGHDFCLISLSDLLTPRPAIRNRVKAAADGDFVIAFYNPQSLRRRTLLGEAIETLRASRPADTPVAVARSVGRPDETITITPISQFDPDSVDMMSLVVVGNSETRHRVIAGRDRLYTPRGYARKMDAPLRAGKEGT